MKRPKYSICICNYNMNRTISLSIESLIKQINDEFEIVVVDDGSNDKSVETLIKLKNKYPSLRVLPLKRDRRRKLGETRNVSIKAARGEYVLLHIDADDVWEPYLPTFVEIYHEIEKRCDIDNFMLSGMQINMATKELLINNPYRNIYYGEDRILWAELGSIGKLITLNHKVIRTRIPIIDKRKKLKKIINSQYSAISVAFCYASSRYQTFIEYLKKIFFTSDWSFKLSLLNLFLLIPAMINGCINRPKFINQMIWNYKKFCNLNLKELEKKTLKKYGKLNLNKKERNIFIIN